MFRGISIFDNFYFNYHIEANQVNFSPFSCFELCTPSVHRSVPSNVHTGTVIQRNSFEFYEDGLDSMSTEKEHETLSKTFGKA